MRSLVSTEGEWAALELKGSLESWQTYPLRDPKALYSALSESTQIPFRFMDGRTKASRHKEANYQLGGNAGIYAYIVTTPS